MTNSKTASGGDQATPVSDPNSEGLVVALSGGVDSSVTLHLLSEQGVDVTAVFMKNWEEDDTNEFCSAAEDLADAKLVCDRLRIPLRTVNLSFEYWETVFSGFLEAYQQGLTPNPDIQCNQNIKFHAFLDFAVGLGATGIATGHYARIEHRDGRLCLLKGTDQDKDQSYFLHRLNQRQLSVSQFPIGAWEKGKVREYAKSVGLPTHDKKGSTGICFIGERPFKEFLSNYIAKHPGDIMDIDGTRRGRHDGLVFHTIGQRRGLGIGGQHGDSGQPWYVIAKHLESNELVVAQGHDHPLLFCSSLVAREIHWIAGHAPSLPLACRAKIRHRQSDQDCVIVNQLDDSCTVKFATPQRAVAPGQAIVFYLGEECLGGAYIARTEVSA